MGLRPDAAEKAGQEGTMLTWPDVTGIGLVLFFVTTLAALLRAPARGQKGPEVPPEECPTCGREFTVQAQIDWRPKS